MRVVVATVIGSALVLLLGGVLLQQQAAAGIEQVKRASALAEASVALDNAEQALRDASSGQATSTETFTRVAFEAVERGAVAGQYLVVIQGPVSEIRSSSLDPTSVPEPLRAQMAASVAASDPTVYVTSTQVRFLDSSPSVPGIVVSSTFGSGGQTRYPIYFIFPMAQEQATLQVLQQAMATTGVLMLLAMGAIAVWVSRQVIGPLRAARVAAQRLASGQLSERMPVRGTDDLAGLAVSMNYMASQLQDRIQQLEELSALQQRFVADVSHELRTPLTTVRLAADVLYEGRGDFSPVEQRSAVLMREQLDRFESLLADLLEISRFDAGAVELSVDEVDVSALVEQEVDMLRPLAQTRDVDLRFFGDPTSTAVVDARRIGRVLRNLLTNAIEHGESQPVDVTVAHNDEAVAITVRDRGVGFVQEDAEHVFHRFWRADPSRARSIGGTGLGLAISLEDVRLHGGYLNAWGSPQQGAQFRVTLPRKHGTAVATSPLPLAPSDNRPALDEVPA